MTRPVTHCLLPLLIAHRVLQEARPQLLSVVLTSLEVGGHFMLRVRHTQVAGSSLQRVDRPTEPATQRRPDETANTGLAPLPR
jgi:hypothetical protein